MTPDLSVQLAGLRLRNPILTASGTFGYGREFAHLCALEKLGGIVTKGLSIEPMAGNPGPRVCETRGGFLNSIGLQNIGIDAFIEDVVDDLKRYEAAVIVNVFGYTRDDYCRVAEKVQTVAEIAAVELNASCPNVERGGIEFGHDAELLGDLVAAVRAVTDKPLIVKLSPNTGSAVELAEVCEQAGADIVSCINTVMGMAIDSRSRRPLLHTVRGGLSGPAVKPIALRFVFEVARSVELPVIGIGGIETVEDVLEFLLAGASAVQIGTSLFRNPRIPEQLVAQLEDYLRREDLVDVGSLIGAVDLQGTSLYH